MRFGRWGTPAGSAIAGTAAVAVAVTAFGAAGLIAATGTLPAFAWAAPGPETGSATGLAAGPGTGPDPAPCQVRAADVDGTGQVARSTCAGIGSTLVGAGGYDVSFPGGVADCVAVASLRSEGLPAGTPPGEITADPDPGGRRTYQVRTFDHDGHPADRPFQIALECVPPADAGVVVVRYPDRTASVKVRCGMSPDAVVLATAQNDVGIGIEAAVPDRKRCLVDLYLSTVPKRGHPVEVGWELRR